MYIPWSCTCKVCKKHQASEKANELLLKLCPKRIGGMRPLEAFDYDEAMLDLEGIEHITGPDKIEKYVLAIDVCLINEWICSHKGYKNVQDSRKNADVLFEWPLKD